MNIRAEVNETTKRDVKIQPMNIMIKPNNFPGSDFAQYSPYPTVQNVMIVYQTELK